MSKRNKKPFVWKTQKEFAVAFAEELRHLVKDLWETLEFLSSTTQWLEEKQLRCVKTLKRVPKEVIVVVADVKRVIEDCDEIVKHSDHWKASDSLITGRLEHIDGIKDTLRDSCKRFRRNCELLHENFTIKEKLFARH